MEDKKNLIISNGMVKKFLFDNGLLCTNNVVNIDEYGHIFDREHISLDGEFYEGDRYFEVYNFTPELDEDLMYINFDIDKYGKDGFILNNIAKIDKLSGNKIVALGPDSLEKKLKIAWKFYAKQDLKTDSLNMQVRRKIKESNVFLEEDFYKASIDEIDNFVDSCLTKSPNASEKIFDELVAQSTKEKEYYNLLQEHKNPGMKIEDIDSKIIEKINPVLARNCQDKVWYKDSDFAGYTQKIKDLEKKKQELLDGLDSISDKVKSEQYIELQDEINLCKKTMEYNFSKYLASVKEHEQNN